MGPRKRLVIADDYQPFVDFCKQMFETEFDIVGVAHDGLELIAKVLSEKPDAVILDISMPLLNGLDAGERLKREMPSIQLIFVTAGSCPLIEAAALERGAPAIIHKGDGLNLKKVVESLLGISAQVRFRRVPNEPGTSFSDSHCSSVRQLSPISGDTPFNPH